MPDFARVPHRDLRVADADRDAAAQALGEHFSLGRLDATEHDERLDAVWRSKTYGDLDALFRDLPRPHPGFPATTSTAPSPVDHQQQQTPSKQLFGRSVQSSWNMALKTLTPLVIMAVIVGAFALKSPGLLFLLAIGWWCWGAGQRR